MKKLTTTKAVYRSVEISVSSDRFGGKTMFCCNNTLTGAVREDKWFDSQREALAHERLKIADALGFSGG